MLSIHQWQELPKTTVFIHICNSRKLPSVNGKGSYYKATEAVFKWRKAFIYLNNMPFKQ